MKKFFKRVFDKLLYIISKLYYLFIAIILAVALFNIFYNLKNNAIYSWDEARHGINAYEMLKNNDFIINTYGYKNDYWNLKPPLSYWLIMFGYKTAGFNPLGLRLYSGVSAFLTILIVTAFVKAKHGRIASLISASVLTTSIQYITYHNARTGDADAPFVFFFTLSMISMILIEKSVKWIYLAGFFFSCAFLTKSWHSLSIMVIGGLYLLFSKTAFKLKIWQWAFFIFCSFYAIITWGILRFKRDGVEFFHEMVNYDLLARTSKTLEGHIGDRWYYIDLLQSSYFLWIVLLFGGFIAVLALYTHEHSADKKNYILAVALWILVPFFIYTGAKTKIAWYILPIFPPMAICIGAFASKLIMGRHRNAVIQAVLIVLIIASFNKNELYIKKYAIKYKVDNTQIAFQRLGELGEYKGANAYIIGEPVNNDNNWLQSDQLAAELYADLIPKGGGLEGFIKDKSRGALLIFTKNERYSKIMESYSLRVVLKTNSTCFLCKE